MTLSVVVGMIVLGLFMVAVTVGRVPSVLVWIGLALGLFLESQVFPENRNQRTSLAIGAVIGSGVLTGWWRWRIVPQWNRWRAQRNSVKKAPPRRGGPGGGGAE